MPITPWRPFWDLDRFFEEEWPDFWRTPRFRFPALKTPRVDISETKENVIAEVELPGVEPKDIDVNIEDNVLTVKTTTRKKKEEKKKDYYRKEISAGFYRRSVPLPAEVKGDKAEATYEDGILKVVIPKVSPKKVKKKKGVKIKVKGTKTA